MPKIDIWLGNSSAIIAPSKYLCQAVEWVLGFNKTYIRFHFEH